MNYTVCDTAKNCVTEDIIFDYTVATILGVSMLESLTSQYYPQAVIADYKSDQGSANLSKWTIATNGADWSGRFGHEAQSFDGKMWVMGGVNTSVAPHQWLSDVWYSTDGVTWTLATYDAPLEDRQIFGSAVFDDKLWIFGGQNETDPMNDVWSSSDGINWMRVNGSAAFSRRHNFETLVFDNKMWIIGGANDSDANLEDVWYTSDGAMWYPATYDGGFRGRTGFASTVHNSKMWVFGGGTAGVVAHDVWSSADGVTWNLINESSGWLNRTSPEVVTLGGMMWLSGGRGQGVEYYRDVWSSADGALWTLQKEEAEFQNRTYHRMFTHDGRMWLTGGQNASSSYMSDVWYSSETISTTIIGAVCNVTSLNGAFVGTQNMAYEAHFSRYQYNYSEGVVDGEDSQFNINCFKSGYEYQIDLANDTVDFFQTPSSYTALTNYGDIAPFSSSNINNYFYACDKFSPNINLSNGDPIRLSTYILGNGSVGIAGTLALYPKRIGYEQADLSSPMAQCIVGHPLGAAWSTCETTVNQSIAPGLQYYTCLRPSSQLAFNMGDATGTSVFYDPTTAIWTGPIDFEVGIAVTLPDTGVYEAGEEAEEGACLTGLAFYTDENNEMQNISGLSFNAWYDNDPYEVTSTGDGSWSFCNDTYDVELGLGPVRLVMEQTDEYEGFNQEMVGNFIVDKYVKLPFLTRKFTSELFTALRITSVNHPTGVTLTDINDNYEFLAHDEIWEMRFTVKNKTSGVMLEDSVFEPYIEISAGCAFDNPAYPDSLETSWRGSEYIIRNEPTGVKLMLLDCGDGDTAQVEITNGSHNFTAYLSFRQKFMEQWGEYAILSDVPEEGLANYTSIEMGTYVAEAGTRENITGLFCYLAIHNSTGGEQIMPRNPADIQGQRVSSNFTGIKPAGGVINDEYGWSVSCVAPGYSELLGNTTDGSGDLSVTQNVTVALGTLEYECDANDGIPFSSGDSVKFECDMRVHTHDTTVYWLGDTITVEYKPGCDWVNVPYRRVEEDKSVYYTSGPYETDENGDGVCDGPLADGYYQGEVRVGNLSSEVERPWKLIYWYEVADLTVRPYQTDSAAPDVVGPGDWYWCYASFIFDVEPEVIQQVEIRIDKDNTLVYGVEEPMGDPIRIPLPLDRVASKLSGDEDLLTYLDDSVNEYFLLYKYPSISIGDGNAFMLSNETALLTCKFVIHYGTEGVQRQVLNSINTVFNPEIVGEEWTAGFNSWWSDVTEDPLNIFNYAFASPWMVMLYITVIAMGIMILIALFKRR